MSKHQSIHSRLKVKIHTYNIDMGVVIWWSQMMQWYGQQINA